MGKKPAKMTIGGALPRNGFVTFRSLLTRVPLY